MASFQTTWIRDATFVVRHLRELTDDATGFGRITRSVELQFLYDSSALPSLRALELWSDPHPDHGDQHRRYCGGLVVVGGLIAGQRLDGWTGLFLTMTVLTSVTGFFPLTPFLPSHKVGIFSLLILPLVIFAR